MDTLKALSEYENMKMAAVYFVDVQMAAVYFIDGCRVLGRYIEMRRPAESISHSHSNISENYPGKNLIV